MYKWTEEKLLYLKYAYELGIPCKEIAKELKVTYDQVRYKGKSLKIHHKFNRTPEQYILDLKEKCPTQIVLEKYKGIQVQILHKCLVCNTEYLCAPASKLQGWGHCGSQNNGGGINSNEPGIAYLVRIPEYDIENKWFIKLGITNNTIKQRFKDNNLKSSRYEIILERHFDLGSDAMLLEKEWKSNVKEYLVNLKVLKNGNTETFLC